MTAKELRGRQQKVRSQGVQAVNDLMNAANGHPYAQIAWPHRPLHSGREAIESCQALLDDCIAALEERDRVKLPDGPFAALCQWAYDKSWNPETIDAQSITYKGVTFVPDTKETTHE